jgi:hypothetical protein
MGNKQSKPDWNNDEKHQSVSGRNALESRSEADSYFEEPNPLPRALDPDNSSQQLWPDSL